MQTKTISLGSGRILTILISGVLSLIAFIAAVSSGPLDLNNLFLVTSCYFSLQVCVMTFMFFCDEETFLESSRKNSPFMQLFLGIVTTCIGAWFVAKVVPADNFVGCLFWTGVALWFIQSGFSDICNVSYLWWKSYNERKKTVEQAAKRANEIVERMNKDLHEVQVQDDLCADLEGFLSDSGSAGTAGMEEAK